MTSVKIQYVSDVHLEHLASVPYEKLTPVEGANILVLAGDIGRPGSKLYKELLNWVSSTFEHILVVLGNHECYGSSFDEALDILKASVQEFANVHVLSRSVWFHPNRQVVFAGATLWSQIDSRAFELLNDRRYISLYKTNKRLSHEDFLELHRKDAEFFEKTLNDFSDYQVICITHHAPLMKMNGKYEGSDASTGFCTDLRRFFKPPLVAWISGHTHQSMQIIENGILCASNCLGYKHEFGYTGYKKNAVITLEIKK